jgi:hypothetical protein
MWSFWFGMKWKEVFVQMEYPRARSLMKPRLFDHFCGPATTGQGNSLTA